MSRINIVSSKDGKRRLELPYGRWMYAVVLAEVMLGLHLIVYPSAVLTTVSVLGALVLTFFGYAAWVVSFGTRRRAESSVRPHNQMPDKEYRAKLKELKQSRGNLIKLFWKNVDECPVLLKRPERFRKLVDILSQDLETEVLADAITSREEYLSRLEQAGQQIEFANIELGNLIRKEVDPREPVPIPVDPIEVVEDPDNQKSPSGSGSR